jgi:hypothetical protein
MRGRERQMEREESERKWRVESIERIRADRAKPR